MHSKLAAELKAITRERKRAIRETMALLKVEGLRIPRGVIAAAVGNIMTAQRLGYALKLNVTEAERARLLERIRAEAGAQR